MIIRQAEPSDFPVISTIYAQVDELHREAHPNVFRQAEVPGRPNDYLQALCDEELAKLIVAELEGRVIGFSEAYIMTASAFPVLQPRRWVVIDSIAVDEHVRGTGAGQLMLDYIEDWAKSMGIREIELKVYSFNEGAIKFYERNGFGQISSTMGKILSIRR